MKTILVIGGENAIGRKVIAQLQQQNYQIRALVDNIESARQLFAENVKEDEDLETIKKLEVYAASR